MKTYLVFVLVCVSFLFVGAVEFEDVKSKVDQKKTYKVEFPTRANIYLIVNGDQKIKKKLTKVLATLLNGISLMKYRLALYSTNGLSDQIVNFQSKDWMLKDFLDVDADSVRTMQDALGAAKTEAEKTFSMDKNMYVALTDSLTDSKDFDTIIDVTNDAPLKFVDFYDAELSTCTYEDVKVFNECNLECDCSSGTISNCYRTRSQFSRMLIEDRLYYIKAYKELGQNTRFQEAFYNFLLIHPSIPFGILHSAEHILPFHRKYTLMFESLLRLVDCRLTVPYWNFPLQGNAVFTPSQNYHMWDEYGGFGTTDTNILNSYCLSSGHFAFPEWRLPIKLQKMIYTLDVPGSICQQKFPTNATLATACGVKIKKYFNPACVSRVVNPTLPFPTYEETFNIMIKTTSKNFNYFVNAMMQTIHAPLHDNMGGTFGTGCSTFNPEFFPFHSMIDAIWDFWQHKGLRYQDIEKDDKKTKIVWFNVSRNMYIDNANLGFANMKIKYTPIFS